MIYLLYGSDSQKARTKLRELVSSLIKKKPDASHVKITDENFEASYIEEYVGGMGLFSQKTIVEVDNVFRNKEAKEEILARIKDIAGSDNIFVFLEGELNKAELTKFEKHAEKVQEFAVPDGALAKAGGKFNIFALTDALGRRDKKNLWVLYQKALMHNSAPEEIHGILFWQIKAMMQAARAKNASESGLNPYVFQKSKDFLRNYNGEEVAGVSSKLVRLYHEARRGLLDFERGLEAFILEI